jgi:ATP-dependent exoDNAse (exonuclease V) beta subunit
MSSNPSLADAEARRRIREDLGATLFVEAAAGTGKTSALVSRIVSLLRTGTGRLNRIAAVTFTEKAAGEMKLRLRAEIEKARVAELATSEERARLEEALSQLELARIGTIHAFCGDLLHERPVEAGVDPLFEVAPTEDALGFLDRAFDRWFQEALADPPEGVRRILRRRPRGFNPGSRSAGPRELLRGAVTNLVDHRDFPAAWRREPFERDAEIDAVMTELSELGALAQKASRADDWLAKALERIRIFCQENALRESVRGRDYDGLEAELRDFARSTQKHWTWKGSPRQPFGPELPRVEVLARRDAVRERLERLASQSDADLAALLREELRPVVEAYEAEKESAGRLDFLDLLVRARDLVRDDRGVREELQERFSHFFVDEFQDTDPLQAEILVLLAADDPAEDDWHQVNPVPGKLFLVGDPKQSIYRFRRADVAIYEGAKQQLLARGAEVVHLATSFRSLPSIQQAVNAAFEPRMRPGGSQAEYVALEPFREEVEGRPSLVALPVPRPYGDYGKIVNWKIEASFPDAVGSFVDWLVNDSGWSIEVPDGSGRREPICARHVCLLFRRFKSFGNDVTRPYVRALEARRVPHVLVGGRSFHEREEVEALRNALSAIEWPDDELSVFATLRGPFFALGDDALLAYRYSIGSGAVAGRRLGRLDPLRRHGDEELAALDAPEREVADALAILRDLHRARNRRPIAETLSQFLASVRAHAGIAIWPTGEQALANCLRVIDLARRFERRGAPSFRAFVATMDREAERGEAQDAPVVEEGTEGVRIMTVHRAKGLEFPVVILADPTANQVSRNPSRHIEPDAGLWAEPLCGCTPHELIDAKDQELERDAEEAVRVAYVAATRARELLVVPVVGDEERPGWIDILNPAVHPARENKRESELAPGCPTFGEDSVFDRGPRGSEDPERSIRPGRHVPQVGEHSVVWWDPRALDLDREEQVGLRQERILVADEGQAAEAGTRAHDEWQRSRAEALESGAQPCIDVRSVTALSHDIEVASRPGAALEAGVAIEARVAFESVDVDRATRPGGRRFGTLVHAILAEVPLATKRSLEEPRELHEELEMLARQQGRLVGASAEEVSAAVVAVAAALEHPLLQRAAAAAGRGELRRETPVLLLRDDGVLVEGIVDLAFCEDSGGERVWTVVDFKTDSLERQEEFDARRASYEAQVQLYVDAIEAATQQSARGVVLRL